MEGLKGFRTYEMKDGRKRGKRAHAPGKDEKKSTERQMDSRIRQNLRAMAEIKEVKLGTLARALGKSDSAFSRILNGKGTIHARYLPRLAREMGCTCEELMKGL